MTDELEIEEASEATEIDLEPIETDDGETPEVEVEASNETVVTFGDDEATEKEAAPAWVKDLRKKNRELSKSNASLEKKLAGKADDDTALGAEPTLEDCDYDADQYRDALRKFDKAKSKQDAKAKNAQDEQDSRNQAYQGKLSEYQEGRGSFDADSFDEAEDAVKDAMSETQQSIIIQAFGKGAAPLISGLGRDDKRLKELAGISDPIAFTVAVTRLESAMKVSQRKPKTAPETRVAGQSRAANLGDKTLEKLEAESEKTGDRSAIVAYKRKLRKAS